MKILQQNKDLGEQKQEEIRKICKKKTHIVNVDSVLHAPELFVELR